jgi:GAF domain-containing protein
MAVLVVVLMTVLLGTTVTYGVMRMARIEERARQDAYAEIVQRGIFGQLQASQRVVRALSDRPALRGGDSAEVRELLAATLYGNAGYLSRMMVIETSGTVVAAFPSEGAANADEVAALAEAMRSEGTPPFAWVETAPDDVGSLWCAVPLGTASGASRVLLADVRTEFLLETLSRVTFSNPSAAAFLLDSRTDTVLAAAGDARVPEADARRFEPSEDDESRGAVRIATAPGEQHVGVFGQVPGLGTLDWRVVVVESETRAAIETLRALRPAIAAWGVAVLLVLGVTVVSFGQLVRPLRELERQASALASGASLGAVEVRRDDEVGRLWRSFNSLTTRVTELRDVSHLLASSYDGETVLDGIASSVARMLGGCDTSVLLLSRDGQTVRLARASGALAKREGMTIAVSDSPWLSAALSRAEVVSYDPEVMSGDPVMALHSGGLRRQAGVLVPLVKGTRRLGALVIGFPVRRPLSADDRDFDVVRSFAAQASIALDNARLFEEERVSREQAQALQRVAELLTRPKDLRAALDEAAHIAAELLGFTSGSVMLSDPQALDAQTSDDAEAERLCLAAARQEAGAGVAVADDLDLLRWEHAAPDSDVARCLEALGVTGAVVIPLGYSGGRAGLLVLGTSGEMPPLTERGLTIAGAIAAEAGLALENAYLFQQARSRADNLETIFRISQAVSSSLQTRVVLNRVLDVVQKIFSADAVLLMSYDAARGTMGVPMARGLIDPAMIAMEFASGSDIPGKVFESRAPMRIDDLEAHDTPLARAATSLGLGSALAVPLLARGRSIGVLCIFSREGAAFPREDLELLSTFAVQAALAIDNAQLYGREHHVATVLQKSIRPTLLPSLPGIDASSGYVPGGDDADIGGDYYDMFTSPNGRVVLAIGDVCGSGIEAATKTSMLKYSVRSMVAAGLGPADVLRNINTMIVDGGDPADIVTLWLGVLDTETGALVWANGGHPPALLLDSETGRMERLGTTGALLGAVAAASYTEGDVAIGRGGTLLMYTDGVTEARDGVRFFGEGRVRRALRRGGSAREITDRLLSSVERFSRSGIHDDVAILTVVLTGPTGEAASAVSPDC